MMSILTTDFMRTEETVTALYDYTNEEQSELSFVKGDKIIKLNQPTDEGWCRGRLVRTGNVGLFPIQFTHNTDETEDSSSTPPEDIITTSSSGYMKGLSI